MDFDDFGFRYGIEEEFFLVRPDSGRLVPRVSRRVLAQLRRELGDWVSSELLQSQIEIASPILTGAVDARERMNSLRARLAEALAPRDLALLAAGTHPLGAWREQNATEKHRYQKLLDDFQIVARRNLVCGLHVHVEIPDSVDRIQVMNRLLCWLPLFLALSTSSPFWDRQRTGLLGYRQSMYDEWPRTGIPDHFADETEYFGFADLLKRGGAVGDASSLWWSIRPALRFPTLELRIADSCTRLEDTLAIAALYRCLVRRTVRDPQFGAERGPYSRRVIDENRWRAKRWGLDTEFLHENAEPAPVRDWLARLRGVCAEDARALDTEGVWAALDALLERGSSAHAQLALYHERRRQGDSRADALQAVVDWLVRTTGEKA